MAVHPDPTLRDVRRAAARLHGVAHRTPILTTPAVDALVGARVYFKSECGQRGRAFKFRGAYNRLASLSGDELGRGVVAASSGNHAQAVAIAARILGTSALILMPEDAPDVKRERTLAQGAEVVTYDRYGQDRDELLAAMAARSDRTIVHPFDDPFVIAGQGTVALELIEELGSIDVLVCPVGGGGLISGSAVAARDLLPRVRIVGVEPEAGDDVRRSLHAGERIRIPVPRTIADGLQLTSPGRLTFPLIQRLVDEVVCVSDAEIVAAMRTLAGELRVIAEPSGACAFAAVLADRVGAGGGSVGVVISGGNVSEERFRQLVGEDAAE